MKTKLITTENMEALAVEIIEFLQERDMFQDVNIYCNNKCLSSRQLANSDKAETKLGVYYISGNCSTASVVEYNNPSTITMTFEGPLYHALNYGPAKTEDSFRKLFNKYGLYFELGYAWSLAAYPI